MSESKTPTVPTTTPKIDGKTPSLERGVSPSKTYQEQLDMAALLAEPISRSEVLSKDVPWDNYASGGLLSQQELAMIRAYDKKTPDQKHDLIDETTKGQQYVMLFMGLIKKVSTPETIQYILATLNDLLDADPERRLAMVIELSKSFDLYSPLLSLLRRSVPDWFINKESSLLFTKLLCNKQCTANEEAKEGYLTWLCSQLSKESLIEVRLAVNSLQKLLLIPSYRESFAKTETHNGLSLLQKVADSNIGPSKLQLLYEVCCCIWLCLYSKGIASKPPPDLIPTLVSVVRQIQKEKVRRVCIAALRNLLLERDNRQKMVACLLHRLISTFKQRKWGDQEIEDDIQTIDDQLQQEVQVMSSWDMFRTEIASGVLEWSPVHKSEHFWRENVTRFEEDNWAILARLRDLIRSSKDKQVLSVACFDLGEFVRFHPRGRTENHS